MVVTKFLGGNQLQRNKQRPFSGIHKGNYLYGTSVKSVSAFSRKQVSQVGRTESKMPAATIQTKCCLYSIKGAVTEMDL